MHHNSWICLHFLRPCWGIYLRSNLLQKKENYLSRAFREAYESSLGRDFMCEYKNLCLIFRREKKKKNRWMKEERKTWLNCNEQENYSVLCSLSASAIILILKPYLTFRLVRGPRLKFPSFMADENSRQFSKCVLKIVAACSELNKNVLSPQLVLSSRLELRESESLRKVSTTLNKLQMSLNCLASANCYSNNPWQKLSISRKQIPDNFLLSLSRNCSREKNIEKKESKLLMWAANSHDSMCRKIRRERVSERERGKKRSKRFTLKRSSNIHNG